MFETAAIRQEHVSLKNAVHQFTRRPHAAAEVLTMRRLDGGRTDLAGALREFTRGVLPDAPLFHMPAKGHVAEMLKADLADAGIQYRDDAGRVFDFHGLRHFFITSLSRANVHPRTAQELARHSSIGLTMSVYTHMARVELVDALRELPDLNDGGADSTRQRATGTAGGALGRDAAAKKDGATVGKRDKRTNVVKNGAQIGAHFGDNHCHSPSLIDTERLKYPMSETCEKSLAGVTSGTIRHDVAGADTNANQKAAARFELANNGFAIRPLEPLGYAAGAADTYIRHDPHQVKIGRTIRRQGDPGSTPLNCRVEALQMDDGDLVGGSPVDGGECRVSQGLPCRPFMFE